MYIGGKSKNGEITSNSNSEVTISNSEVRLPCKTWWKFNGGVQMGIFLLSTNS